MSHVLIMIMIYIFIYIYIYICFIAVAYFVPCIGLSRHLSAGELKASIGKTIFRETGVSWHHGGKLKAPLEIPRTITALSYGNNTSFVLSYQSTAGIFYAQYLKLSLSASRYLLNLLPIKLTKVI